MLQTHSRCHQNQLVLVNSSQHNITTNQSIPNAYTNYSNIETYNSKRESLDFIEESPTSSSRTNSTFGRFVNYSKRSTAGIKRIFQNENSTNPYQRSEVVLVNTKLYQPQSSIPESDDDDLPPTQPISSFLLKRVVAFVEIRINDYNRSSSVKDQLRKLGAIVLDSFTRKVTHLVFQEGTLATYNKAIKYKTHMVSALWIDECKKKLSLVPEHLFPPYNLDRYASPSLVRRIKPMKRDIRVIDDAKRDEEDQIWEERLKHIQENICKKVANHNLVSPSESNPNPTKNNQVASPPNGIGMIQALKRIAGSIDPIYEDYVRRPASPTSDEEMVPIPLAVRLLRQFLSPKYNSPQKPEEAGSDSPSNSTASTNSIEANLRLMFQTPEPSKTNHCDMTSNIQKNFVIKPNITTNTSSPKSTLIENQTPVNNNRRRSLRHLLLTKTPVLHSSARKETSIQKQKTPKCQPVRDLKFSNTSGVSTMPKKRKLYNIPRIDDSPLALVTIIEDKENDFDKLPTSLPASQMYEKSQHQRNVIDMDLTDCLSGKIIEAEPEKFVLKSLAINGSSDSTPKTNTETARLPRRSSCDFKKRKSTRIVTTCRKKTPTLVCTGLYKDELMAITSAVSSLGVFSISDNVISSTTHVVCNNKLPPRRTLNLLRGIVRGCWIVGQEWVLNSLEAGKWLGEENYETTNFSASVQQCRIEKLAFGPAYQLQLFHSCGPMFISRDCKPPTKDLIELVKLCGGRITSKASNATVIIGGIPQEGNAMQLSEKWLLDSVSDTSLKSMEEYKI